MQENTPSASLRYARPPTLGGQFLKKSLFRTHVKYIFFCSSVLLPNEYTSWRHIQAIAMYVSAEVCGFCVRNKLSACRSARAQLLQCTLFQHLYSRIFTRNKLCVVSPVFPSASFSSSACGAWGRDAVSVCARASDSAHGTECSECNSSFS